jgi:hypothetical protein
MMQKFEMCHEFPGSGYSKFLISVTLRLEPPDLPAWESPLRFQYRYEVLPESVITRFITRMHAYIDENIYWRHGVQLRSEDGANQAQVQADLEDHRIAIDVAGRPETRRDLLKLVRADFRKIHASFEGLSVTEEIPLNEDATILVDYQDLLIAEQQGEREYRPPRCHFKVSVRELLDGIETVGERRERSMSESKEGKGGAGVVINIDRSQIGGVGQEVNAQDMQFQQIWNQVQGQIDLPVLAQELEELKKHLKGEAETPEQFQIMADVAAAESEAKAGNGSKVIEHLKKAGGWAFETATQIGVRVAAEVIKKSMYL